jgi:hypothetical protein
MRPLKSSSRLAAKPIKAPPVSALTGLKFSMLQVSRRKLSDWISNPGHVFGIEWLIRDTLDQHEVLLAKPIITLYFAGREGRWVQV